MPARFEMRARRVELVLLARGERDSRAHLAQRLGHLQADAARAARDDRGLAGEIEEASAARSISSHLEQVPRRPCRRRRTS